MDTNRTSSHGRDEEGSGPKEVGEQVSEFELPGAGENGIEMFSLSEYIDDGAAILTFYPFDFSPICTSQLCVFRDAEWLSFTENVDILGISVDSAYSHQQFREQYDLNFPLLTDRLASVAEMFGVRHDTWENHPSVCQRALFAIDDTRTIKYRWYAESGEQPTLEDLHESIEWLE